MAATSTRNESRQSTATRCARRDELNCSQELFPLPAWSPGSDKDPPPLRGFHCNKTVTQAMVFLRLTKSTVVDVPFDTSRGKMLC
jgi:hypothetical protein